MNYSELMDFFTLLKQARKVANSNNEDAIRIAVLGSHSIQHFVGVLRYLLLKENIEANIFESEYNGILMNVLDDKSQLYKFNPQIVIIMTYYTDVKEFPELLSNKEEIDYFVDKNIDVYKNIWNKLSRIKGCSILQTNFVVPVLREIGNLESNYLFSKSNFYRLINLKLIEQKYKNVTIIDMDSLASNVGKYNWFDNTAYFLNKSGFKMDYIGLVADIFTKQILAIKGKAKKCLILDLDNTLWGGVVGDNGYDGIQLNPNNPIGEAYLSFQKYVLGLKKRGVILAICSKNNLEIAQEPFLLNKEMLIKLDDIACFVANWNNKADNIKLISEELNIGTDSFVFFDDNKTEREIVSKYLPEVTVIDVPDDPADYALALEKSNAFEWLQITKEDLKRTNSYINNKKRNELKNNFVDYDEFLENIEMTGELSEIREEDIDRFVQLINKSNQFNLTTKRYANSDIINMLKNPSYKCLNMKLKDKFDNYGIVSCVILYIEKDVCFIDTWLMSCRVLKRTVEDFIFNEIVDISLNLGVKKIIGKYIKTKKNMMVSNFYNEMGFNKIENDNDKSDTELFELNDLIREKRKTYIYKNNL